MRKQAVLLDAGGVLLDESEYEISVANSIIEVIQEIKHLYGESDYKYDFNESIDKYSPHNRQYIIWKHSSNNLDIYNKLWNNFIKQWKQNEPPLKLMPGIDKEIQSLAETYKLVIAGQYGIKLINLLEEQSLIKFFVNKFSQDNFILTKPDPQYFKQIIDLAEVNENECIMIGDRIDKDVIPSKLLGIQTVFIRSGVYKNQKPRTPDEIPDLVLESTIGMAKIIKESDLLS